MTITRRPLVAFALCLAVALTLVGCASSSGAPSPSPSPPPTTTPPPTPTVEGTPVVEPPPSGAGLYGVLTVGPMCPVVRVGVPCPDRRYEGTLRIESPSGTEVATVEANVDGEYAVELPAGDYRVVPLSPQNSPLPAAGPVDATVFAGTWTRLDIAYDSGIR